MHYYQHHIGDFLKDTANLTNEQRAVYLMMLWKYYADEKPITDSCEDLAFAMRSDEKTVRLLLRHFFVQQDDGWHQQRCDIEISRFHEKAEKAKSSANARWSNANAMRTHTERNAEAPKNDANQEPITNNQQPIEKKKGKRTAFPCPVGVDEQVWFDWLQIRKAKRQPITQTALDGIEKRAIESGYTLAQALVICCENSWAGFNPSWLHERKQGNTQVAETTYQRSMRLRMQEAVPQIAAADPSIPAGEFFRTIEMVEVVQ